MDRKCLSSAAVTFLCALAACCSTSAYAAPASDACSLLSQSQVSAALGTNVEAAQRIAPRLCQWSTPNQPNSMNGKKVALTISEERAFGYAKNPIVSSAKTMPASGICDDAVYSIASGVAAGPGTSLYVRKGNSYFVVHVYGVPEQTKVMAIEKALAVQSCSKL